MKRLALLFGSMLLATAAGAQKPTPPVNLAVLQAALRHPPLEVYLNPTATNDQGLCILKNGLIPTHYQLFLFGRPVAQRSEAVLLEYQHFHYLIFTHTFQTGDSARVEFQARLSRVEVHLDLKRMEKDWQVSAMQLLQLP